MAEEHFHTLSFLFITLFSWKLSLPASLASFSPLPLPAKLGQGSSLGSPYSGFLPPQHQFLWPVPVWNVSSLADSKAFVVLFMLVS